MPDETLKGNGQEKKQPDAVRVTYVLPNGEKQTHRFVSSFSIGRDETCQVLLLGEMVSKNHATLYPTTSGWWVRDLDSRNGVYVDGRRISHADSLKDEVSVA